MPQTPDQKANFTLIISAWISIMMLCLPILFWNHFDKKDISISIEINVGEIVGGILVGVAALLAAASYALGRSREGDRG